MRACTASPFWFSVVTRTLINPWSRWSSGSAIRVQHDTVTGLASFKLGKGLVDIAHREVLGLRRDMVPCSKVEHRLDRHRRASRRTRDAPLLQDERECCDRDRFQHGTDDMQPAVRRERADQRVLIERHVDGADQEVEAATELPDRRRVVARDRSCAANFTVTSGFLRG